VLYLPAGELFDRLTIAERTGECQGTWGTAQWRS
jgi:hypothetical protein